MPFELQALGFSPHNEYYMNENSIKLDNCFEKFLASFDRELLKVVMLQWKGRHLW
jgi:hypothetical protein